MSKVPLEKRTHFIWAPGHRRCITSWIWKYFLLILLLAWTDLLQNNMRIPRVPARGDFNFSLIDFSFLFGFGCFQSTLFRWCGTGWMCVVSDSHNYFCSLAKTLPRLSFLDLGDKWSLTTLPSRCPKTQQKRRKVFPHLAIEVWVRQSSHFLVTHSSSASYIMRAIASRIAIRNGTNDLASHVYHPKRVERDIITIIFLWCVAGSSSRAGCQVVRVALFCIYSIHTQNC